MPDSRKRVAFYGDDFTGSTDAMEALTLAGLRTVLFLERPAPATLRTEFADSEAFGIAGVSRSLTPAEMERELPEAFRLMAESGAAICHYKTCSTFDSAPEVGNIGRAIELARRTFVRQRYVPLLVGAPALKRYTVFGQHFAALNGVAHRLDRHPVMSRHPMTPMREADLLRHLAGQTDLPGALVDIVEQSGSLEEVQAAIDRKVADGAAVVLFDALDRERLAKVGGLLWREAAAEPLFVAGSSGIEYALAACWQAEGRTEPRTRFPSPGPAEPLLFVSGSCSSVTQSQIDFALAHGFAGIRVDPADWIGDDRPEETVRQLAREALSLLADGRSVLLFSAKGPEDASIARTRSGLAANGRGSADSGRLIGERLGLVCRAVLEERPLKRIAIAGGDTSGFVMKQLGVYAMEMAAPLVPGAPLCRAYSRDGRFDGLEVVLKGGQMGGEDFFAQVREGRAS
ncbi:four-carbon acid sugar kinase family protein [Cohnella sp. CBP 2801]|uniref:Four-carbon acid sugar kinase family protein n=2 Tax=Cohnella zeiphila TaxID=2761120 RepID=A0A7X0SNK5_9BACL|nr:four-carbon acid sugar kinase family protein [Cohnella zeiphila]